LRCAGRLRWCEKPVRSSCEAGDPPIEVPEEIVEFGDRLARHGCHLIVLIGQDVRDRAPRPGDAFGKGEPTIEQQRNVSTTLRQPAFEFKLGLPAFGLAGWSRQRLVWAAVLAAFW
jgi:hypothetical protein